MSRNVFFAVVFLAGGVLVTSLHLWAENPAQAPADQKSSDERTLIYQAYHLLGPLPGVMPGGADDTPERVALGRRLYFERGISINKTQACNDCHRIDGGNAGVDNLTTSKGAKGLFGSRNSPTVLNAGFQIAQFWDGRAATLADQAQGPPLNPIEMGMPDGEAIVQRLKELQYEQDFRAAFPETNPLITFDTTARAIAAFERTLITPARLDDFMRGDASALDAVEQQGLATFMDAGCLRCHGGPFLGGVLYQKVGIYHPYSDTKDLGRFDLTDKESDRFVFKVPMLRNVTLTAPYFHDGKVLTLAEAIDRMAWMQLGDKLSREQIHSILRFFNAVADPSRVTATVPAKWVKPNWASPDPATINDPLVARGHQLLTHTYTQLGGGADAGAQYIGNGLACRSCHQDDGTKAYGIAWVGVVNRYPTYRGRSDKIGTIQDRVNGCMERSMNGKPLPADSKEMEAIVAYFTWLSKDAHKDMNAVGAPPFDPPNRRADPDAGAAVYAVACQTCHAADGQGYRALSAGEKGEYTTPPLWGNDSYNNGAGMHRVLTAAGFIQANMPMGTPWNRPMLSVDQAYDVSAYINSKPRPQMSNLETDYPKLIKKPVDCPYPPYADDFPQAQHQFGPFQPINEWKNNQAP